MANERSPRYPSIGLDEAVILAEKLWNKEKRTAVPAAVVGSAWGYKSASGPVRAKIGALRQYGLIDGTKDGIKVSDLAIEILVHPEGSREQALSVRVAALNPSLFLDVYDTHQHSSDDALKAHLITKKGFSEDAAARFVSSFRATIALVEVANPSYDETPDENNRHPSSMEHMQPDINELSADTQAAVLKGAGGLWLKVPFRGSEMTIRIESGSQKLTKGHLERVRKYLELAEDDLDDGVEASTETQGH